VKIAGLAATPVPTFGIVGTADPYQRDFERLKEAMPFTLIDGASHNTGRPWATLPWSVVYMRLRSDDGRDLVES
jgi:hypothetical protein